MPKITISYRRADSQDITGRIFDRLVGYYGRDFVFRDIDSIRPGIDFREQIAEALQNASVLLVVMGPKWVGRARGSETRIDNEADFVRIEVETALGRKIPIIPVLVGGAAMPTTAQLPESLREFAYRQAVAIDGGRDFDIHLSRLSRAIDDLLAMQGLSHAEAAKTGYPVTGTPIVVRPTPPIPPPPPPAAHHAHAQMQPPPLPSAASGPPAMPAAPATRIKLPTMPSLKPAIDSLKVIFQAAKVKAASFRPADSLKPAFDGFKTTIAPLAVWPRPLWLGGGAAVLVVLLAGAWIGLRKPDAPTSAISAVSDKPGALKKVLSVPSGKIAGDPRPRETVALRPGHQTPLENPD